jgi:hypothetical protein
LTITLKEFLALRLTEARARNAYSAIETTDMLLDIWNLIEEDEIIFEEAETASV